MTERTLPAIRVSFHDEDDGSVTACWEEALLEGHGRTATEDLKSEVVDANASLGDAIARGLQLEGYPARLWELLHGGAVVSVRNHEDV